MDPVDAPIDPVDTAIDPVDTPIDPVNTPMDPYTKHSDDVYVALNCLEARLPIVDSWNEKFLHIEHGRVTKFGAPGM